MKSIFIFGWVALFSIAISMPSPAQSQQNIVAGTGPLTNSVAGVAGFSVVNLISGNSLFPVSGKQTVLYIGFTQGGSADATMVLYTTKRNNFKIQKVTPVTFGGSSSATILLDISNSGRTGFHREPVRCSTRSAESQVVTAERLLLRDVFPLN